MYPSPENPDQPDPRHGGLWPPRSGPPSASVPLSAPLAADVLPSGASAPSAVPLAAVPPAQPLPGSAAATTGEDPRRCPGAEAAGQRRRVLARDERPLRPADQPCGCGAGDGPVQPRGPHV